MRNRTLFVDKNKAISSQKPKLPQVPPSFSSMTKPAMSQTQFNYQFSQFTLDLPIYKQVKQNLKYLYQLYLHMCQYGGLVTVLSNNKLRNVISEMSLKFPELINMTFQNVLEHYVKFYLFSFEVVINTGKRIENQKLICLGVGKFIEGQQLKQVFKNKQSGIRLYDQDLVVLNSLCQHLHLDYQIFNTKNLVEKHGEQFIKVIVQEKASCDSQQNKNYIRNKKYSLKLNKHNSQTSNPEIGFQKYKSCINSETITQELKKIKSQSIETTLKDYLNYYSLAETQNQKDKNDYLTNKLYTFFLKNNGFSNQTYKTLYGQLDPKDQFLIQQISNKIDGTFLAYKQNFDLLSYADQDLSGVTLPIFSFQLHGSWCGGSQQPFALSKIDINFGPDETEWFCISEDNINKFQNAFISQLSFGVQKIEGQWFQQLDWFIQRKIPIKKVIQKKGDGIIIGNGSLSWFRSIGKSLHASWNIMAKSEKQIVSTIKRCNKIKQMSNVGKKSKSEVIYDVRIIREKKTKIPLKSILLKIINHEQYSAKKMKDDFSELSLTTLSLPSIVIIRQHLKKIYTQQERCLNQMTVRQDIIDTKYKLYHIFDAQSFCIHCQMEIQNYFVNHNGLCCLECISKHFLRKKISQLKDKTIYHKYDPFWLYQLIYYGNDRPLEDKKLYFPQFHQICSGEFILNNQLCIKKKENNQNSQLQQTQWESILTQFEQQQLNRGQTAHIQSFMHIFKKKLQKINIAQTQCNEQLTKNFSTQTNLCLSTLITDEQIIQYSSSQLTKKLQMPDYKAKNDNDAQHKEINSQSMKRKQRRKAYKDANQQKSFNSCSEQQQEKQKTYKYRERQRIHYDREQHKKDQYHYKREVNQNSRFYGRSSKLSEQNQQFEYSKYSERKGRSQYRGKKGQ